MHHMDKRLKKQLSKKKMRVNTKVGGTATGIVGDFEVPSPMQEDEGPIALQRQSFVSGNKSVMVNVFQQSDFVHTPTTPEGKGPKKRNDWKHAAAKFSPDTPQQENEEAESPMTSSPLTAPTKKESAFHTATPKVTSSLTLDKETLENSNATLGIPKKNEEEEGAAKTPSNLKSKYFKKPPPLRRINTGLQNGYKKPHFLKSPSPVVEFKPLPKEV